MQDEALDLPNYGAMCVVCYAGGGQAVKIEQVQHGSNRGERGQAVGFHGYPR